MVLGNLGIGNTALGFAAGFTGEEIIRRIEQMGVQADFIRIENGISRINLKLKTTDGTEINGVGPQIDPDAVGKLTKKLEALKDGDTLVLAGDIPASMPGDIYSRIMEHLAGRKLNIVVDATRDLLVNVLGYHPFLIKPNHHELGEIFDVELRKRSEVVLYAKELQKMGAKNVLVSMAGEGAVLIAEDGNVYEAAAPKGTLVNGVGAGDSMVAGFICGWLERREYRYAFEMGVSAGSASAFSERLATKEEYHPLIPARIWKTIALRYRRDRSGVRENGCYFGGNMLYFQRKQAS